MTEQSDRYVTPRRRGDRFERTRQLAREGRSFVLGPCKRCGHSPDWHRLDDALNISPVDPAAKFRCYGYDVEAPGPHHEPGELCDCPDYAENHHVRAAHTGEGQA